MTEPPFQMSDAQKALLATFLDAERETRWAKRQADSTAAIAGAAAATYAAAERSRLTAFKAFNLAMPEGSRWDAACWLRSGRTATEQETQNAA